MEKKGVAQYLKERPKLATREELLELSKEELLRHQADVNFALLERLRRDDLCNVCLDRGKEAVGNGKGC